MSQNLIWQSIRGGSCVGFLDQVDKFFKEVEGVVGSWGGFWVILYAEEWLVFVFETGDGAVVQVEVGDLCEGGIYAVGINTEAVVV